MTRYDRTPQPLREWRTIGPTCRWTREWAGNWLLTPAILALVACAAPDRPPAATSLASPEAMAVIRSPDSAGIAFDIIGRIRLTNDSHVVVSLPRHRQLVVFSREGRMEAVLGRPGEGPGEFRALGSHGVKGDSIWAYDPVSSRLTWFSPTGQVLASSRIRIRLPEWPRPVAVLQVLEDGSLLVEGQHSVSDLVAGLSPLVPFGRADPQGRSFRLIGRRDLTGTTFSATGSDGGVVGLQPFAPSPFLVASADGSRFAHVVPDNRPPGRALITVYRADGRVGYERSHPFEPLRLTSERFDSALERLGPPFTTLPERTIHRPEYLPPVSGVQFGPEGTLWLSIDPPVLRRDRSRWVILDPDGAITDTVELPAGHRLLYAGSGWYWADVTDSLGIPELRQYPVKR